MHQDYYSMYMITALIIVKLSRPSFTGAIENAGKKLQHGGSTYWRYSTKLSVQHSPLTVLSVHMQGMCSVEC